MSKRLCEIVISAIIAGVLYTGCLDPAEAQNVQCATRPFGDNSNACASTAFVQTAIASLVTLPNHSVVIGTGSNSLRSTGPATTGYSLIANGLSSDPTFQGFIQAGTSASTRTWQDKAREIISLKDYGDSTTCTGGVVDDTATFLAAENYLTTLGGGIIVLPYGTCQISAIRRPSVPIIYVGQGEGGAAGPNGPTGTPTPPATNVTTVKWIGAGGGPTMFSFFMVNGGGMKNLRLDGNLLAYPLVVDSSINGQYDHLYFQNCGSYCLILPATQQTTAFNTFGNTYFNAANDGIAAIYLTGSFGNADHNTFTQTTIAHGASRAGIKLGFSDNNHFDFTYIYRAPGGTACGVLVDPTESVGFPVENSFDHLEAAAGYCQPGTTIAPGAIVNNMFQSTAPALNGTPFAWGDTYGVRTVIPAGPPSFIAKSLATQSSAIQIEDGQATANKWWLLVGVGSVSDGKFAIFDRRQNLSRLIVDTAGTIQLPAYTGGITSLSAAGVLTNTSITGLVLGAGTGAPSAYAGTTCTNQFLLSLSASGASTCSNTMSLHIGGTGTTGTQLTFQTTTGNGTTDAFVWKRGNNGAVTAMTLDNTGLGVGLTAADSLLSVNGNTVAADAPITGTIFHVTGADNVLANFQVNGYNKQPNITFHRANGTLASKTGVLANEPLGEFDFGGYTSAGAYATKKVIFDATASENWSGTATGTQFDFWTTPNTTTTVTLVARIHNSGGFSVGNTTDPGTGAISANVKFVAAGNSGLSATKTVRASGGAADCTLIYTGGILTGGTC